MDREEQIIFAQRNVLIRGIIAYPHLENPILYHSVLSEICLN